MDNTFQETKAGRALSKVARRIARVLFSRLVVTSVLVLVQGFYIFVMVMIFSQYAITAEIILILLSIIAGIRIINGKSDPAYKMAWLIPILLVPVFGGLMYLALGTQEVGHFSQKRVGLSYEKCRDNTFYKEDDFGQITENRIVQQARYIRDEACFPIWKNTEITYLPIGEKMFEKMVEELEKAEHYIFLEYFIVEDGLFWGTIHEILKRKAAQGVDVRMIYDDIGCVSTLPVHYDEQLRKEGIGCIAFNHAVPLISVRMNNRSHRKIMVIDGYTSFTGGINLADEYINKRDRFGHWKDTGVMLKGQATWNFTLMFLELWTFIAKDKAPNYVAYRPNMYHALPQAEGFVAPYAATPMNTESVSSVIYYNMITKAQQYCYITTPYLLPNHELMRALCIAARNGVDVRIITPRRWDKYYVHALTQTNYKELIQAGVKIYEYVPGFIHAKSFVCDDEMAIVGSINLDYRSLHLHFEDAVWFYQNDAVMDVKKDFMQTQAISQRVDEEFLQKRPFFRRLLGWILKVFAPLL